jgi:dimeric dUTPase (all-alpha-NTP-PPase superfamily)
MFQKKKKFDARTFAKTQILNFAHLNLLLTLLSEQSTLANSTLKATKYSSSPKQTDLNSTTIIMSEKSASEISFKSSQSSAARRFKMPRITSPMEMAYWSICGVLEWMHKRGI